MKETIRANALKQRNDLKQAEKSRLDKIIHHKICEFLSNKKDKIIALYYSIGSEVETHSLINILLLNCYKIALPAIDHQDSIAFVQIASLAELRAGKFCPEPIITQERIVAPDIVIVPLIAFDKYCNRIGYGKGYYDHALSQLPNAHKVGIAYATQEIEYQNIYYNDVQLECIITDKETIYAS